MSSIGILFPMKESQDGGVFKASRSTQEAIQSDLIALLTLKRGQRVMQSRMYSPIYDYVLEPMDEISQNELEKKIVDKVREFIPQIEIKKILMTPNNEENYLGIKIIYSIVDFFEIEDFIVLNIATNN